MSDQVQRFISWLENLSKDQNMPDITPATPEDNPVVEGHIITLAESLFELGDIMDQVKSAVVMYKQTLINSGFSVESAESMCVAYHNTIVALAFYPQIRK